MSKPNKKGGTLPPSKSVTQPKGTSVTTGENTSATGESIAPIDDNTSGTGTQGTTDEAGSTNAGGDQTSLDTQEPVAAVSAGATLIAGLDAMKQEEIAAKEAALGLNLFSEELKEHIRKLLDSGSPLAKLTIHEVLEYVRAMAPRTPVDETRGGQYQVRFYRAITNIINNGSDDFRLFFGVFLRMVYELRADHVFNERYVMRFLPTMPLDERDRRGFQFLTNLFTTTADASTRAQTLRQTDLGKAVSHGLTDAGQKRLISYYQA